MDMNTGFVEDLFGRESELRGGLIEYLQNHPTSRRKLALKIGISYICLRSFMSGDRRPTFGTLLKIDSFLSKA